MENEKEKLNMFDAILISVEREIQNAYQKQIEKLEYFFDYKEKTLVQHFKFQNDLEKYSSGVESMANDENYFRLSDLFLESVKKKIHSKEIHFMSVVFSFEKDKRGIEKIEVFYIDVMNFQRHFDSRKSDEYNFPTVKNPNDAN